MSEPLASPTASSAARGVESRKRSLVSATEESTGYTTATRRPLPVQVSSAIDSAAAPPTFTVSSPHRDGSNQPQPPLKRLKSISATTPTAAAAAAMDVIAMPPPTTPHRTFSTPAAAPHASPPSTPTIIGSGSGSGSGSGGAVSMVEARSFTPWWSAAAATAATTAGSGGGRSGEVSTIVAAMDCSGCSGSGGGGGGDSGSGSGSGCGKVIRSEISRLWPQVLALDPVTGEGRSDFYPFTTRDSVCFMLERAVWRFDKWKRTWTVRNTNTGGGDNLRALNSPHFCRLPRVSDLDLPRRNDTGTGITGITRRGVRDLSEFGVTPVWSFWGAATALDGVVLFTVGESVWRFDANLLSAGTGTDRSLNERELWVRLYPPSAQPLTAKAEDRKEQPFSVYPVAATSLSRSLVPSAAVMPYLSLGDSGSGSGSRTSIAVAVATSTTDSRAPRNSSAAGRGCPGYRDDPDTARAENGVYLYGGSIRNDEYSQAMNDLWFFDLSSIRWTCIHAGRNEQPSTASTSPHHHASSPRPRPQPAPAVAIQISGGASSSAAAAVTETTTLIAADDEGDNHRAAAGSEPVSPDPLAASSLIYDAPNQSLYLFGWCDGSDDQHRQLLLYEFDLRQPQPKRKWIKRSILTQSIAPASLHPGEIKRQFRKTEYAMRCALIYPLHTAGGDHPRQAVKDRPALLIPICLEPNTGAGGQTWTLFRLDLGTLVLYDESDCVGGWPNNGYRLTHDSPATLYPTYVYGVGEDRPDRRTVFWKIEYRTGGGAADPTGGLNCVWPSNADQSILETHTMEGHDFTTVSVGSKLYNFGGRSTQRGCIATVYNCVTNAIEWTGPKTIDEAEATLYLPAPRVFPAVAVSSDGRIAYMSGGRLISLDQKSGPLPSDEKLTPDPLIHRFDLMAWKWIAPLTPSPQPADLATLTVTGGAAGAESSSGDGDDIRKMPSARIGHCSFVWNDRLYIWGGLSPEQYTHFLTSSAPPPPPPPPPITVTPAITSATGTGGAGGTCTEPVPPPPPPPPPLARRRSASSIAAVDMLRGTADVANSLDFFAWDNRLHSVQLSTSSNTNNPSSLKWSSLRTQGPAPVGRIEFAHAVIDSSLYVMAGLVGANTSAGGSSGGGGFVVHRLDLVSAQWTLEPSYGRVPTAVHPQNVYRAVVSGTNILLFDVGATASGLAVVHVYDTLNRTWQLIPLSQPILPAAEESLSAGTDAPQPNDQLKVKSYTLTPGSGCSSSGGLSLGYHHAATVFAPIDQKHFDYQRSDAWLPPGWNHSLSADLQRSFNHPNQQSAGCDVVLTIDSSDPSDLHPPIYAHSFVVCARSPFFCQLLQSSAVFHALYSKSSPLTSASTADTTVIGVLSASAPNTPSRQSGGGGVPPSPIQSPLSAASAPVVVAKLIKSLERSASSAAAAGVPASPRDSTRALTRRRIRLSGGGAGSSSLSWNAVFDAISALYTGVVTRGSDPLITRQIVDGGVGPGLSEPLSRSLLRYATTIAATGGNIIGADEVVCVVESRSYRVHRALLTARSPFFRALMSSPFSAGYSVAGAAAGDERTGTGTGSGGGTFQLSGISARCFARVIEFLYCDTISLSEAAVAAATAVISVEDVLALIDAAALYGIRGLMDWAEQHLITTCCSKRSVGTGDTGTGGGDEIDVMLLLSIANKYSLHALWTAAAPLAKPPHPKHTPAPSNSRGAAMDTALF